MQMPLRTRRLWFFWIYRACRMTLQFILKIWRRMWLTRPQRVIHRMRLTSMHHTFLSIGQGSRTRCRFPGAVRISFQWRIQRVRRSPMIRMTMWRTQMGPRRLSTKCFQVISWITFRRQPRLQAVICRRMLGVGVIYLPGVSWRHPRASKSLMLVPRNFSMGVLSLEKMCWLKITCYQREWLLVASMSSIFRATILVNWIPASRRFQNCRKWPWVKASRRPI